MSGLIRNSFAFRFNAPRLTGILSGINAHHSWSQDHRTAAQIMLLTVHESHMGLAGPRYYVSRRGGHYEYAITPGFKTCGTGVCVMGIGLEAPADQGPYREVHGMARSGLGPLASGRRGLKDPIRRSTALALRDHAHQCLITQPCYHGSLIGIAGHTGQHLLF